MKSKNQFILLGLFVIFGTTAMIIIGLWLSVGISKKTYYTYISIFHEPVDGLNINSNVLYNGVSVGKVSNIELDKKNPANINVTLSLEAGTPITTNTYAVLQQQGITGLAYIGLQVPKDTDTDKKTKSKEAKAKSIELVQPKKHPPYPIIKSRPSLISSITDKFEELTGGLNAITSKVNLLLSEKNTQYISSILKNVNIVTEDLKRTSAMVHQIANNISTSTHQFDALTKKIEKQTLPSINEVLIPQLNNTLITIDYTASNLSQFIDKLSQNPSLLVKGQTPAQPGPGE
ncbi:MlaD family protein [Thiotrichales bacterium 19S11-10]|nr:MlaD family protein [Thiotrichales bacterium 19S11-10]